MDASVKTSVWIIVICVYHEKNDSTFPKSQNNNKKWLMDGPFLNVFIQFVKFLLFHNASQKALQYPIVSIVNKMHN